MVESIAIIGAGLMGGSMALALRPSVKHLSIIDNDPNTVTAVKPLSDLATTNLRHGLQHADLILVATPVRTILQLLAEIPKIRPDGCLLLDLGSTKGAICQAMEQLPATYQAIGGHPMCGKESSGFRAAAADLYHGHPFILCRNGRTTAKIEETALAVIQAIGAKPIFLKPDVHDTLVGLSSHLPYLTSALMMQTAVGLKDDRFWQVTASGFRDITRLAGSSPKMMLDILLTNQKAVLAHLDEFERQVAELRDLLKYGKESEIAHWLATTHDAREAFTHSSGEK